VAISELSQINLDQRTYLKNNEIATSPFGTPRNDVGYQRSVLYLQLYQMTTPKISHVLIPFLNAVKENNNVKRMHSNIELYQMERGKFADFV
jgi:hypothetical protein